MIIFSYKISDLLAEIKSLSEYGSSLIPNDQPEALEKAIIIDRDDEFLKNYLKTGCSGIAQVISGYTKNLYDTDGTTLLLPFEFDITYLTVANSIVFRINMPDTWDTNLAILMDESMKNAMINFVMYLYFKRKKMPFEIELDEYNNALSSIRTYIHQRTKSVRRNYNILE